MTTGWQNGVWHVSPSVTGWMPMGVLGVAAGPSPRGDFLHACVYRGKTLVHDPHPSRQGLLCLKEIDVFALLDPIKGMTIEREEER